MWKKRHFAVNLLWGLGFSAASFPSWRRLYETFNRRSARGPYFRSSERPCAVPASPLQTTDRCNFDPLMPSIEACSPLDPGSTTPLMLQPFHATPLPQPPLCPLLGPLRRPTTFAFHTSARLSTPLARTHSQNHLRMQALPSRLPRCHFSHRSSLSTAFVLPPGAPRLFCLPTSLRPPHHAALRANLCAPWLGLAC